jgi:hypothetical protein
VLRSLVCLALAARVAVAEPVSDDENEVPALPASIAGASGGVQLVRADADWRYQLVTAPRIAPQLGALAATSLDVVAGRATAPIAVLGDEPARAEPARWPYAVDGDAHGRGPLRPVAADDQRIAALFAVTTFSLGAADQGLRVLEVRLRYEDACAIWLGGVEVARRALPRGRAMALATAAHGPEWETFYVLVAPGLLRLGDNVLAIEVHPAGRRQAPELAVDVIGRRALGVVRGPTIAAIGATTATIAVDTDAGVAATLEWGTGEVLDHRIESTTGQHHAFALAGLPAKTQIAYRVIAGGVPSPRFAFHTAPAAGDPIRIGVYGDVRGGHATHRALVDAMLGEGLDVVAVTGDMVLQGSDEADWQRFFAVTGELIAQVPYLPTMGNHDLGWDGAGPVHRSADVFGLPPGPPGRPADAAWYSTDLADVHLVFLDSNAYERPEQEAWLDADLAAARAAGVRAILAFTHAGPYARGLHRGDKVARERYVPILARHRVDLLLAGHDHLYQRGEADGVRYVVSGGGGASLYKVSCGVDGKPACPHDGMQKVMVAHHYVVLAIGKDTLEMCPRRADGSLLEACVRYKLRR